MLAIVRQRGTIGFGLLMPCELGLTRVIQSPNTQTVIHEEMRKSFSLAILATLVFTVSAAAQNTYQFDNFSFENGVRVQLPPPPVVKASDKVGRKLTSSKNFKYSPPAGSLIHLTNQVVNPSMGG